MKHSFRSIFKPGGQEIRVATWQDLKEGDDAPACETEGMFTTVQVSGDAVGVDILGRIEGEGFHLLNDSDTLPLAFSHPGIKSCNDMFLSIKPRKTGSGSATVSMLIRRN